MNDLDFKIKYIKYKVKYLQLKKKTIYFYWWYGRFK